MIFGLACAEWQKVMLTKVIICRILGIISRIKFFKRNHPTDLLEYLNI